MENIKAIRIIGPICDTDLTNLPMGLEILYLDAVWIAADGNITCIEPIDTVDLNLPPTLNCLYVNESWYNPPYKVPYGCKMIRVSPRVYGVPICQKQKNKECPILNKIKSLYPDNQIKNFYSPNQFKQYFKMT